MTTYHSHQSRFLIGTPWEVGIFDSERAPQPCRKSCCRWRFDFYIRYRQAMRSWPPYGIVALSRNIEALDVLADLT